MYDDFNQAIQYNEIIQDIISSAQNLNDPSDFGVNVASILKDNGLINKSVYDVVTGKA